MTATETLSWSTLGADENTEIVSFVRELEGAGPELVVEGTGAVKDAVLSVRLESGGRADRTLTGVWDLLSLKGSSQGGLYVLLARESVAGPQQLGGILAQGRLVSGALRIGTVLPSPAVVAAPASPVAAPVAPPPAAPPPPVQNVIITPPPASPPPAPPAPAPMANATASSGTAGMPKRPAARDTSVEQYPEEGDLVTHFAFGRCTVMMSDGERLRLQQERDSRVREVALSMLRVGEPTMIDNRRHWDLSRKN